MIDAPPGHPSDIPIVQRAIVVDDDPVIRGILRSTLAGIGIGVSLAIDGAEALAIAARLQPGLFMLDLQMPGTNGLETCRQLRNHPRYAKTPIVILTGHDGERTHSAALAVGATMFLTKPFKPAALLAAIAPILNGATDMPAALARPWAGMPLQQDVFGLADPEYRNQIWGRQDAMRAAERRARGEDEDLF